MPLSEEGRRQVRETAVGLGGEVFDLVLASSLRRAWESARILSGGAPVRLEPDFREIHFGRWEGLNEKEIEAADPVLYRDWKDGAEGFEYPAGEPRAAFRERVLRGLARLQESDARCALVAVHKGVIRTIAEALLGEPLEAGVPELGGVVALSRNPDGSWFSGRHGSNPAGLDADLA